jgi:hypothetical protein
MWPLVYVLALVALPVHALRALPARGPRALPARGPDALPVHEFEAALPEHGSGEPE